MRLGPRRGTKPATFSRTPINTVVRWSSGRPMPTWVATSAGAATRSATARTRFLPGLSQWRSSKACRETTPSTGRPPRCSSTSWPTATKRAAPARPPISMSGSTLRVAFIKGMQGDDPKYWQAAALLKHFLANSNEKGRAGSSSDFDERLFYEYYSVPFRMGWAEGGARCFMAAYNAWNMIPMTVHPIIQNVVVRIWGVDGVICTDAGSLGNMIRAHCYYGDLAHGAAGAVKAGMNQFLDQYEIPTRDALKQNLLTEADLDKAIKGTFRIWARLGFLDPPEGNPYAKIGAESTAPWTTQKSKDSVRLATQKSIVLLKNAGSLLPLDKTSLKSVAVIGPRGDEVVRDWYGSTPPYTVTPLAGIKNKVGSGVTVEYADGKDVAAAVALAKSSDVAVVCVGNSPNPDNKWMKVNDDSEGREGVDRQNITLG